MNAGEAYTYPTFKTIDIQDKDIFGSICYKYPSYSDFSLLSILSWGAGEQNSFSLLNGNLVIKIKDYLGDSFLYSLLGSDQIDESISVLIKKTGKLSMVPEVVVEAIKDRNNYIIEHDRDSDDYILSSEKVYKLEGKKFKHLRHDINTFKKLYPRYEVKAFAFGNKDVLDGVTLLTEKWYQDKGFDKSKIDEERSILQAYIKNSTAFECVNLGLFVEGRLIAYFFSELLPDKTAMGHFCASDRTIETSSYMMEYETAKYLYQKGYIYQNMQQDTGLPGLRRAKLFYNPEFFLKKYTITLK